METAEESDSSGDTGHAHEVVTLAVVALGRVDPWRGGTAGTVTVHTEGTPPRCCSGSLDVPATTLTASLLSLSLSRSLSLLDMMESILKALPVLALTADVTSIILTMLSSFTGLSATTLLPVVPVCYKYQRFLETSTKTTANEQNKTFPLSFLHQCCF